MRPKVKGNEGIVGDHTLFDCSFLFEVLFVRSFVLIKR